MSKQQCCATCRWFEFLYQREFGARVVRFGRCRWPAPVITWPDAVNGGADPAALRVVMSERGGEGCKAWQAKEQSTA